VAGWNIRSRGATQYELELSGRFHALPSGFAANIYRIAQEALTNAAKHAEATRVQLRLRRRGAARDAADRPAGEIELIVEDDGKTGDVDIVGKAGMGLEIGERCEVARASLAPASHGGLDLPDQPSPGVAEQRHQQPFPAAEMVMDGRVGQADVARHQLNPHGGRAALAQQDRHPRGGPRRARRPAESPGRGSAQLPGQVAPRRS
jgi:hypothetical protein